MKIKYKYRVGQKVVSQYKNKEGSYVTTVKKQHSEIEGRKVKNWYALANGHAQDEGELRKAPKRRRRRRKR